jgi:peptide methionine sulfoxide reductase msrA/msrB
MLRMCATPAVALLWAALAGCDPRAPSEHVVAPAALDDAPLSPRAGGTTAASSTQTHSNQDHNMVRVRVFNAEGKLTGPVDSPRVVKTDAEWKSQLTQAQYEIARNKGTERAFCGTLLDHKLEGVYACVCCGLPLFASNAKFNSGTGWPSFFQPIAPENVAEHSDESYGMKRTEILCARCDCHLGHVFEDGPRPTGLRFCLNSESLTFTKIEDVKTLAEPIAEGGAKPQAATAAAGAMAKAVFAGGCFWCVEAVFEELDGVKEVISGYAGDSKSTADYKTVSTGRTKHAEAVEIIYDPAKITFEALLKVHFATHDPTTLNQQGADVGTQYRSAIFYLNDEQKQIAEAFIADLNDAKAYQSPIVTTLEPLTAEAFYPAETYHQNYVCNNPNQGYVQGVALPKVDKVRKQFKDALKAKSPLQN